jgi:predicted O-methyltransferase YrrM
MSLRRFLRRASRAYETKVLGRAPDVWSNWDNILAFEVNGREREWGQLLMYHEMMTEIGDVPGDVAEFGVAVGVSFIAFARILDILERGLPRRERRKLYGFDSFEGLPELTAEDQASDRPTAVMQKGGFHSRRGYQPLFEFVEKNENTKLVKGWFNETLPKFLADNPHASFAFVHMDADLYESTKTVLELVWDRINPGGIILFDELFHRQYPGETVAYREVLGSKTGQYTMHMSRIMRDRKFIVKKL